MQRAEVGPDLTLPDMLSKLPARGLFLKPSCQVPSPNNGTKKPGGIACLSQAGGRGEGFRRHFLWPLRHVTSHFEATNSTDESPCRSRGQRSEVASPG